jgi:ABC-type transport system involved in multi-copper enzyme maturation permease subunit
MGFVQAANGASGRALNFYIRFTGTTAFCVWCLGVATAAAARIAHEREEDTWTSLIATPLSGQEIVRGKMLGALWTTRWIGLVWFLVLGLGLSLGGLHPLGALAVLLATPVYLAFACSLGTFFSLRARTSSRALTATVAVLIVCNGAYLMLLAPLLRPAGSSWETLILVGVAPFVQAVSLFSYAEANELFSGMYRPRQDYIPHASITCVVSVFLYATAAVLLAINTISSFDRLSDRPMQKPRLRELDTFVESDESEPGDPEEPVMSAEVSS